MKMTSELKIKVMSLGNRLALKMGGDRNAAFIRAWAIVKAGGLELAVKGTSLPHVKIRYYCEKRDPDFDKKTHDVLAVTSKLSCNSMKKGK